MPRYACPIKPFECHSCGLLRQPTIGPHSLTRSRPKDADKTRDYYIDMDGIADAAKPATTRWPAGAESPDDGPSLWLLILVLRGRL
jgi:hypothetical protein